MVQSKTGEIRSIFKKTYFLNINSSVDIISIDYKNILWKEIVFINAQTMERHIQLCFTKGVIHFGADCVQQEGHFQLPRKFEFP